MSSFFLNSSAFVHPGNSLSKLLFHRRGPATENAFAVEPWLGIVLGISSIFTLREERVVLTCFFNANMSERYGGLLVVNVLETASRKESMALNTLSTMFKERTD